MMEIQSVEGTYRQMYEGMIRKDLHLLSEILDDSFVLSHMTGKRQVKNEFLEALGNGTLNYYSAVHQQMKTDIHGDSAELTGRSVVNAAVFGGRRHTWHLQLQIRLERKEGRWVMLEADASSY